MRTEGGRTDKTLIDAFGSFAKTPKNGTLILHNKKNLKFIFPKQF